MELKTCPGCEKVFLGHRDRQFCPICAVIQMAQRKIEQPRTAGRLQQASAPAVAMAR